MRFLTELISTFFFIGYLPLIPGTFGSVAGLFIYIIFLKDSPFLFFLVGSLTLAIGFFLSGKAAKFFARRDPPQIVIDEICGMFVSLVGIYPKDKLYLLIAFIVFRILDSIKPYPANLFQRKIGSVGIMGDDIVAGIYTSLVVHIIFLLKSNLCGI